MRASEITAAVRAGTRTVRDVVAEALDAAVRLDPILHFAVSLDRGAGDRPVADGPLTGVPFLTKAGTPPDAPIVRRLVAAGAVPIGVSARNRPGTDAQTHGWNGHDFTRNPWNLRRSPGGSSAGAAAAVAAGIVPLATGGDSGGSLRIPAAFCGVVGLKGTAGRVPRPGRSLAGLTTAGLIGSDLDDVIAATALVSGPDRLDPAALPPWSFTEAPGPWRVAYASTFGRGTADPAVDEIVRSRLAGAGERDGRRARLPGVTGVERLAGADRLADVTVVEAPLILPPPEDAWDTLAALDSGRGASDAAVRHAIDLRRTADLALADLFAQVDALVTPTTLTTAHPYDGPVTADFVGDLCWDFNITGHPAVSVPAGLLDGLPVGLQVVAPHGRDDIALSVARRLRAALPLPPVHARI